MKSFKKIVLTVVSLAIVIELGFLSREFYVYTKYKYCHLNVNGRIVSEVDNLINFSGMASK